MNAAAMPCPAPGPPGPPACGTLAVCAYDYTQQILSSRLPKEPIDKRQSLEYHMHIRRAAALLLSYVPAPRRRTMGNEPTYLGVFGGLGRLVSALNANAP